MILRLSPPFNLTATPQNHKKNPLTKHKFLPILTLNNHKFKSKQRTGRVHSFLTVQRVGTGANRSHRDYGMGLQAKEQKSDRVSLPTTSVGAVSYLAPALFRNVHRYPGQDIRLFSQSLYMREKRSRIWNEGLSALINNHRDKECR